MDDHEDPVTETRDGPVVRLRVRPRSRRDEVLGVSGGALRVAVRPAPEGGRATEAALRTLARRLGLPGGSLALLSGAASRDKRVLVAGCTASDLRKRIAEATAGRASGSVDSPGGRC